MWWLQVPALLQQVLSGKEEGTVIHDYSRDPAGRTDSMWTPIFYRGHACQDSFLRLPHTYVHLAYPVPQKYLMFRGTGDIALPWT
jgi:hypothetical protein